MASVVRDRSDSRVRGDCRIVHRRQAGASHGVRRVLPPRQGRRLEERAGRRGEREPGEPSALNIYVDGIERILSGATLLRGEHVERDIRFLRAAGVRIEDQVVERSVTAEHHKRLASGIAVPTRTGNRACRPIPVG